MSPEAYHEICVETLGEYLKEYIVEGSYDRVDHDRIWAIMWGQPKAAARRQIREMLLPK